MINSGAITVKFVFRRESVIFGVKIGAASLLSLNFEVDFHQMYHFDYSLHFAAMVLRRRLVFYLAP